MARRPSHSKRGRVWQEKNRRCRSSRNRSRHSVASLSTSPSSAVPGWRLWNSTCATCATAGPETTPTHSLPPGTSSIKARSKSGMRWWSWRRNWDHLRNLVRRCHLPGRGAHPRRSTYPVEFHRPAPDLLQATQRVLPRLPRGAERTSRRNQGPPRRPRQRPRNRRRYHHRRRPDQLRRGRRRRRQSSRHRPPLGQAHRRRHHRLASPQARPDCRPNPGRQRRVGQGIQSCPGHLRALAQEGRCACEGAKGWIRCQDDRKERSCRRSIDYREKVQTCCGLRSDRTAWAGGMSPKGEFISGWRLSPAQEQYVLNEGKLGGG